MNHLSPCEVLAASLSPLCLSGKPFRSWTIVHTALQMSKSIRCDTEGEATRTLQHCRQQHSPLSRNWKSFTPIAGETTLVQHEPAEKESTHRISQNYIKMATNYNITLLSLLSQKENQSDFTNLCSCSLTPHSPFTCSKSHSVYHAHELLGQGQRLPQLWDLPWIQPEVWQSRVKTKFFHLTVTMDFCSYLCYKQNKTKLNRSDGKALPLKTVHKH